MKYEILNSKWDSFLDDGILYDLIYLDPPFFTQKRHSIKDGESEIYFDDIWESFDAYIIWLTNVFEKCYSKLKPSGLIYSHNNFEINAKLLHELPYNISKNFITNISWLRSHPHNNISKSFGNVVDSIMMFSKTKNNYFNVLYKPLDKKYELGSFSNEDDKGKYSLTPITGERSRPGYFFEFNNISPKYGWRYEKEKIINLHEQNKIHFGKNKPYKKQYLSESNGSPIQNFWDDIPPITRSEKNKRHYPTQKPISLLKRIIESSCPIDGNILDPFAGSGTTLFAAIELQIPKYVKLIDRNKYSIDIIKKNLKDYENTILKFT
jgi:DNA modification methylase